MRLVFLTPILTLALAAPAASAPRLTITPASVAPGGTITLHGKGWPHGASIGVTVTNGGYFSLGPDWHAGPNGRFTKHRKVPTWATPGVRKVTGFVCPKRGACRPVATARFRVAAPAARATIAATVGCGHVDVPGGRAWRILATRISCRAARPVARQCLRGRVSGGWRVAYNPRTDRTTMRSGRRVVSFQLVGGGGCIPSR